MTWTVSLHIHIQDELLTRDFWGKFICIFRSVKFLLLLALFYRVHKDQRHVRAFHLETTLQAGPFSISSQSTSWHLSVKYCSSESTTNFAYFQLHILPNWHVSKWNTLMSWCTSARFNEWFYHSSGIFLLVKQQLLSCTLTLQYFSFSRVPQGSTWRHTVCKFKKFPPGNFFFASTVDKF